MTHLVKSYVLMSLVLGLIGCSESSKMFCETTGGKWASANSECISSSCAKTKTCGKWANPTQWCDKVKIGDSKDNVRFWLGEPASGDAQAMTWTAFKAENQKINAKFSKNRLTKLECPNK